MKQLPMTTLASMFDLVFKTNYDPELKIKYERISPYLDPCWGLLEQLKPGEVKAGGDTPRIIAFGTVFGTYSISENYQIKMPAAILMMAGCFGHLSKKKEIALILEYNNRDGFVFQTKINQLSAYLQLKAEE